MLVLSRTVGQKILIGNCVVTIHKVQGKHVSLAFDAPPDCKILRGELVRLVKDELPKENWQVSNYQG
jgi:carbon storage regulator CsrA